jgi:hypothetical protein
MISYGNMYLGYEPPDNFYEVMDESSKITGAFTAVECRCEAETLSEKRRMEQKNKFAT